MRLSRGLHGDLGGSGGIPGPLDLLHIAVKDVTSSEQIACSSAASATMRCVCLCAFGGTSCFPSATLRCIKGAHRIISVFLFLLLQDVGPYLCPLYLSLFVSVR